MKVVAPKLKAKLFSKNLKKELWKMEDQQVCSLSNERTPLLLLKVTNSVQFLKALEKVLKVLLLFLEQE